MATGRGDLQGSLGRLLSAHLAEIDAGGIERDRERVLARGVVDLLLPAIVARQLEARRGLAHVR